MLKVLTMFRRIVKYCKWHGSIKVEDLKYCTEVNNSLIGILLIKDPKKKKQKD